MSKILINSLVFLCTANIVFSQFRKGTKAQETFPYFGFNDNRNSISSLKNININHNLNMSVGTIGNRVYNSNSYTTSLSYNFNPKLILLSDISIFQLSSNFNRDADIGYDLSLLYKPTENSLFIFSVKKNPSVYYNKSPFLLTN